jgi:ribosomal protein L30E
LIATFLPTATGALRLGAESDLRSVMLGPPGLVILTVTFPALS